MKSATAASTDKGSENAPVDRTDSFCGMNIKLESPTICLLSNFDEVLKVTQTDSNNKPPKIEQKPVRSPFCP